MSKVLYPLAAGPRPTQLVSPYSPGDDTIVLVDVSYLPPAPNLITISHDENFVTLKYDSIDDANTISGITYIEGDNTYVFPEMSLALRTINKYDFDAIHENINVEVGDLFDHLEDFDNPHSVTKTQVGLGSVDNTSDVDKPISTATQQALDDKADLVNGKVPESQLPDNIGLELGITSTTAYYGDKGKIAYDHSQIVSGNPHRVTKSDVGLGNVDNTSDVDKPISSATQEALDGISGDLESHEDNVSNPHSVTKAQVGLSNVDNTSDINKPVSTAQATAIGVVQDSVDNHKADKSNPHEVTKTQVGLGSVDNTADIDKPVSTAQSEAIGVVQSNLDNHIADTSNPHSVTKTQVGLGNVDNTSDANKPISTATASALSLKADLVDGKVPNSQLPEGSASVALGITHDEAFYGDWGKEAYDHSKLTSGNPHNVTKTDVGLGNVNNTSDADKPISTATQAALNNKADLVDGKVPSEQLPEISSLQLGTGPDDAYYGDKGNVAYLHSQKTSGNPHNVTKSDVGLSNVDNTSDANKPVSTAQGTAIGVVQTNLDDHEADTSNPHAVTKAQVGLGDVDNTSDLNKPISTATQTALNGKADLVNGKVPSSQLPETSTLELGETATTAYYGDKGKIAYDHSQLTSGNPHHVTKAEVGLGNVNNTSDADKPVSTAQSEAIGAVQTNLDDHEADTSNPHAVTKSQVGLANVDNTSDANKPISTATQAALDMKADLVDGKVPSSQLPESSTLELGTTATTAYYGDKGQVAYDHSQLTSGNPHHVTKGDVGLSNVDNTSDANKPVSSAQQTAIDGVQDNLDDHIADTANPHGVTKSQVGLSNVDNTSDANKPVSTLQKAAIDAVQDNLDSHEDDTSNPHSVTKAQVGLSNVDNTSDADKPVSTAQQSAISGVQSNLTAHIEDESNPHAVTKSQVGLGNVDNTSDANKPISTATQTALNGKADLVGGKVPASQLPDNIGLELGTTATTAYYGDKGQTAYDHSQLTSGNPHHVSKSDVGLGNVDNTSDADKPISTAVQAALDTKMTGTYSGTTPNLPTINGSAGSQNTVSRGDHTHPSETFTLTGLSVSTSSWVADNTYGIYTWRASITNSAITANHTPIVMFSQVDSSLGIFSRVAETASGVVYIYASEIPESTTTINSIIFIKDI